HTITAQHLWDLSKHKTLSPPQAYFDTCHVSHPVSHPCHSPALPTHTQTHTHTYTERHTERHTHSLTLTHTHTHTHTHTLTHSMNHTPVQPEKRRLHGSDAPCGCSRLRL